jgi:hypothetical protein
MSRRAGLAPKSSRMTGERNISTLDLERSTQPQMTLPEVGSHITFSHKLSEQIARVGFNIGLSRSGHWI